MEACCLAAATTASSSASKANQIRASQKETPRESHVAFFGLLGLERSDRADHFPRLLRRPILDFSEFGKLCNDAFHHFSAFFDVGHFAAPEKHGHLNLVIVLEKANCFLDLEVDVVLAGFWPDTNLFKLGLMSLVL